MGCYANYESGSNTLAKSGTEAIPYTLGNVKECMITKRSGPNWASSEGGIGGRNTIGRGKDGGGKGDMEKHRVLEWL